MEELNLKDLQPFLFLFIGAGAIVLAFLKKTKSANLKVTGEKVEGIVFELSGKSHSLNQTSNALNKVTIRFVTKNKEWITADINQEFASFYTGQYKVGDKVDVYYDQQNPSNFIVDTKQSEQIARLVIAAIGTVFFLVGLYQLVAFIKE